MKPVMKCSTSRVLLEICSWCTGHRETLPLGMCNVHLHAAEAFELIRTLREETLHDKKTLLWVKELLAKVDYK